VKHLGFLKKAAEKLKGLKNVEIVIALLFVAVVLSVYASNFNRASPSVPDSDGQANRGVQWVGQDGYEDQQELKLQKKLSTIKGVGKVEVMITYKSSKEIVTAMNTTQSETVTEEQDSSGGTRRVSQRDINSQTVTIGEAGNAQPLVIKEMEPEIKGVIVIAEGARDVRVKLDLIRAVQTALGVSAQQVEVFEMETNGVEE